MVCVGMGQMNRVSVRSERDVVKKIVGGNFCTLMFHAIGSKRDVILETLV
jgi:hypothetical protein